MHIFVMQIVLLSSFGDIDTGNVKHCSKRLQQKTSTYGKLMNCRMFNVYQIP